MYLHSVLLADALFDEEILAVLSLVSLKLDNFAQLFVFYDRTITAKLLYISDQKMIKNGMKIKRRCA
jgi:hypothetical protein